MATTSNFEEQDPQTYRGYLIGKTIVGEWYAEKDRCLICWAASAAEARGKIDQLLD